MSFKSQSQYRYCKLLESQGRNGSWDCDKWEAETPIPISELPKRVSGTVGGLSFDNIIDLAKLGIISFLGYQAYKIWKGETSGILDIFSERRTSERRSKALSKLKDPKRGSLDWFLKKAAIFDPINPCPQAAELSRKVKAQFLIEVPEELGKLYLRDQKGFKAYSKLEISKYGREGISRYYDAEKEKFTQSFPLVFPQTKIITISPEYHYYDLNINLVAALQNPKIVKTNQGYFLHIKPVLPNVPNVYLHIMNFAKKMLNDFDADSEVCPIGHYTDSSMSRAGIIADFLSIIRFPKNRNKNRFYFYAKKVLDKLQTYILKTRKCTHLYSAMISIKYALPGKRNLIFLAPKSMETWEYKSPWGTWKHSATGYKLFNGLITKSMDLIVKDQVNHWRTPYMYHKYYSKLKGVDFENPDKFNVFRLIGNPTIKELYENAFSSFIERFFTQVRMTMEADKKAGRYREVVKRNQS